MFCCGCWDNETLEECRKCNVITTKFCEEIYASFNVPCQHCQRCIHFDSHSFLISINETLRLVMFHFTENFPKYFISSDFIDPFSTKPFHSNLLFCSIHLANVYKHKFWLFDTRFVGAHKQIINGMSSNFQEQRYVCYENNCFVKKMWQFWLNIVMFLNWKFTAQIQSVQHKSQQQYAASWMKNGLEVKNDFWMKSEVN